MSVRILAEIAVVVASLSFVIYTVSLLVLLSRPRRPGLVRTAVCRMAGAASYIATGVTALIERHDFPIIALGVGVAVQAMWQANSIVDVRLTRRGKDSTRHRRGPPT